MTKNELVKKIENGSDIMFDVFGKHFTILTWCDEGIGIDEQHPNDGAMKYFDSAKELAESYTINGKTLAELASVIKITEYS